MEFSILYAIQRLHCPPLDSFILLLTKVAGNYGEMWLVLGAVLLIFKKTRKCGFAMFLSYGIVYLVGQYGLKDLIARPRPCHIDQTVELLIKRPSSYSCPSTHSAWAFAAATTVFLNHKKAGIAVYVLAALIAFSRMYLFVHFPTDVLFGAVLGVLAAFAAVALVRFIARKLPKKQAGSAQ